MTFTGFSLALAFFMVEAGIKVLDDGWQFSMLENHTGDHAAWPSAPCTHFEAS